MQIPSASLMLLACLLCCRQNISAQNNPEETEFRRGWSTWLKLSNGVATRFDKSPDLYVVGLQVNPQVTLVEHHLRAGVNAGFVYTSKKFSGIIGPTLAYRLASFNLKNIGGLANLHLAAEHSWGTDKQRLAGMGLGFEILQKAVVGLMTHRDYNLNQWWLQAHIGIKLGKPKSRTPEFNQ